MSVENGEWIMHGVDRDDPSCLHSALELEAFIEQTGFLPLFGNRIPGFSVEERTVAADWWTDHPAVAEKDIRKVLGLKGAGN